MKVETRGNIIVVKDYVETVDSIIDKITKSYHQFENRHLIIDFSKKTDFRNSEISSFKDLLKKHNKAKKSFVLVATSIDFNKNTTNINVVPSIQEALDIIEMEEIERDLGF